jgi:hypothetical protein
MVEPPVPLATNATDTLALAPYDWPVGTVALLIVGACGTVTAVTELDTEDATDVPAALTAYKMTEYDVPGTKFDPELCVGIVSGLVVPLADKVVDPPSVEYL